MAIINSVRGIAGSLAGSGGIFQFQGWQATSTVGAPTGAFQGGLGKMLGGGLISRIMGPKPHHPSRHHRFAHHHHRPPRAPHPHHGHRGPRPVQGSNQQRPIIIINQGQQEQKQNPLEILKALLLGPLALLGGGGSGGGLGGLPMPFGQ